MLEQNTDVRVIQVLLGHAKLQVRDQELNSDIAHRSRSSSRNINSLLMVCRRSARSRSSGMRETLSANTLALDAGSLAAGEVPGIVDQRRPARRDV
jgi:hypothetical protein